MIAVRRSAPLPFLALLLIFAICALWLALFVPSIHAPEKHGATAVSAIRSMFDQTGNCKHGNGAQLYSPSRDTWMFLCFHDKARASIWILSRHVSDPAAKEITAIPHDQMRNAATYIRNVIAKRGYILKGWNGTPPDWFWNALPR